MAKICNTVTVWVLEDVLSRVDKWVSQLQQKCKQYSRWDPRRLFCWLVTVSALVTTWVVKQILVPLSKTVCIVVTGVIGVTLLPFAAAIDAVCAKCTVTVWIRQWFLTPTKITCEKQGASSTPNLFSYLCICNCSLFNQVDIKIEALNDEEAATLARAECGQRC